MNSRTKQIASGLVGLTLLVSGCALSPTTPEVGYYYPAISLCLGMAATTVAQVTPGPTPAPVIPSDDTVTCPRCNGTGKVKFGRKEVECRKCNGTGKIKKQSKAEIQEEHSVVQRSWIIPEDSVHDMEDYYDARALAKNNNQFLVIDFAPDWCGPCHVLSNSLLDTPDCVSNLGSQFILLRVKDGDLSNAFDIPKRYPHATYPRIAVVAPNGDYVTFLPMLKSFYRQLDNAISQLGG